MRASKEERQSVAIARRVISYKAELSPPADEPAGSKALESDFREVSRIMENVRNRDRERIRKRENQGRKRGVKKESPEVSADEKSRGKKHNTTNYTKLRLLLLILLLTWLLSLSTYRKLLFRSSSIRLQTGRSHVCHFLALEFSCLRRILLW